VISTESREEYLEAVFKLEGTSRGATITRIAQELGVRPASASQMTSRLVEAGLLRRQAPGTRVALTEQGRSEAVRLVRRHRLSERFLTDYLELPWDQVHEEACRLEHVLSDEAETSLARRLGHPLTCPHGRVIPYDAVQLAPESARCLVDLAPGETCRVSYVSEEGPEFLRYLASCGLRPGSMVKMEGVAPFGGPLTIVVEGDTRHVGIEVARKVFVS
jgi:DtxR family transcriptional regulator, Mn-dependent transcriptional regulator